MRWTPWLTGVAMLAVVSLGCSDSNDPGDDGNEEPADATVTVANFSFSPSTTNITPGQTVRWTWSSGTHNVTFATGTNSGDKSSGTFDRTFDAAGTFDYQCTIYPTQMTGSVVVASGSTGGSGGGG